MKSLSLSHMTCGSFTEMPTLVGKIGRCARFGEESGQRVDWLCGLREEACALGDGCRGVGGWLLVRNRRKVVPTLKRDGRGQGGMGIPSGNMKANAVEKGARGRNFRVK